MPKVHIDCPQCGHSMTLVLTGNRKEADRKAQWMVDNGHVCDDCKKANFEKENQAAAEANKELVDLEGSEKQVFWAETIRKSHFDAVKSLIDACNAEQPPHARLIPVLMDIKAVLSVENKKEMSAVLCKLLAAMKDQNKASWWIDNRNASTAYFARQFKEKLTALVEFNSDADKAMEAEIKAESTVIPEEAATKVVTEIKIQSNQVKIIHPEQNKKLISLLKAFGCKWDPAKPAWVFIVTESFGTPEARAAEIGNVLLKNNFPILVMDEEIRSAAINATFEVRHPRWIGISTKMAGRLSIQFEGADIRRAVRQFSTARESFSSKLIWFVHPAEWQSIRDFAAQYDFRVTAHAEKMLSNAEMAERKAILGAHISDPKAPTVNEKLIDESLPGEIDEALKDE